MKILNKPISQTSNEFIYFLKKEKKVSDKVCVKNVVPFSELELTVVLRLLAPGLSKYLKQVGVETTEPAESIQLPKPAASIINTSVPSKVATSRILLMYSLHK